MCSDGGSDIRRGVSTGLNGGGIKTSTSVFPQGPGRKDKDEQKVSDMHSGGNYLVLQI